MATQKPMCIITINFDTFAMPADAALKVMQLMQQARTCRFEAMVPTDQGTVYSVGDVPQLSVESVKPNNLRMPAAATNPRRTHKE